MEDCMKYKIAIIILSGIILTSIIYCYTTKEKINVLALGDGISTGMTIYHVEGYDYNEYLTEMLNEENNLDNYYRYFNEIDETASNLVTKINNNMTSIDKKIKLKQAIKEADIITISLGMDELNNYAKKNTLGSTKINGFLNKYEEVINIIRKLNDKKIYVIGLYASHLVNSSKISKINQELEKICQRYNSTFINIEEITEHQEFFLQKNNYYPNYKGQEFIYNKIKETRNVHTMQII